MIYCVSHDDVQYCVSEDVLKNSHKQNILYSTITHGNHLERFMKDLLLEGVNSILCSFLILEFCIVNIGKILF